MTKVRIWDDLGRVIADLEFEPSKTPKMSKLFKQYPNAARIEIV